MGRKAMLNIVIYWTAWSLTLILLTWTKWWFPASAGEWRMGFNSAFKELNSKHAAGYDYGLQF
jgi:hypothetical protein